MSNCVTPGALLGSLGVGGIQFILRCVMRRIRLKLVYFMYNIFVVGHSGVMVRIAKDLKLEDAIQFALNLHRSSNVEHLIRVREDGKDEDTLSLF